MLIAFLLQQWLQERASLLRYAYIACLVDLIRASRQAEMRVEVNNGIFGFFKAN
jgi:hypothetical protein